MNRGYKSITDQNSFHEGATVKALKSYQQNDKKNKGAKPKDK